MSQDEAFKSCMWADGWSAAERSSGATKDNGSRSEDLGRPGRCAPLILSPSLKGCARGCIGRSTGSLCKPMPRNRSRPGYKCHNALAESNWAGKSWKLLPLPSPTRVHHTWRHYTDNVHTHNTFFPQPCPSCAHQPTRGTDIVPVHLSPSLKTTSPQRITVHARGAKWQHSPLPERHRY